MHAMFAPCRWIASLACLLSLVAFTGCGGGGEVADRPATAEVTGKVTYKGEPVEGATVTFHSSSPDGRGATGRTDESGNYQLTTFEAGDGAIPGSYQVTVVKTVKEGELSEEETNAYYERGETPPPVQTKELLPLKYKEAGSSGLAADVAEGGDNEFSFELTD